MKVSLSESPVNIRRQQGETQIRRNNIKERKEPGINVGPQKFFEGTFLFGKVFVSAANSAVMSQLFPMFQRETWDSTENFNLKLYLCHFQSFMKHLTLPFKSMLKRILQK